MSSEVGHLYPVVVRIVALCHYLTLCAMSLSPSLTEFNQFLCCEVSAAHGLPETMCFEKCFPELLDWGALFPWCMSQDCCS